jgi:hypothetical protein
MLPRNKTQKGLLNSGDNLQNAALACEGESLRSKPDLNPEFSGRKEASGVWSRGESASVEALERLLADRREDYRLRWRAARALGKAGGEASIGVLLEALGDDSLAVRLEAIAAIGKIGGPAAAKILRDSLKDLSYRVRSRAAKALIRLSEVPSPSPANIDLLIKLLSAEDERVMDALAEMGMAAYSPLVEAREGDSFLVRRDVSLALAALIRGLIEDRPQGESVHRSLAREHLSPQSLSQLYDLRVIRERELVKRVETTNFEKVSERLRGKGVINLWSQGNLSQLRDLGRWEADSVHLESLLAERAIDQMEVRGRTLVIPQKGEHLAIKLSLRPGDDSRLRMESVMQSYLQEHGRELGLSGHLPQPMRPGKDGYLFRLEGIPSETLGRLGLASDPIAICYRAHGDYFTYLNHPALTTTQICKGFRTCAGDLARLARAGIIHCSLIPLFHNREQINTRSDRGVYIWWSKLAGRLDRWRESCSYPNLRLSGIADFEHMEIHDSLPAVDLQHHIGDHLFSLALVLGSYFRGKGEFDQQALMGALRDCFATYYSRLTDRSQPLDEHIDWGQLAQRMGEEMAGDRYMKAILRGGTSVQDMEVMSGPHLGMFNGPFPIPELIRAIHIASLFGVLEI